MQGDQFINGALDINATIRAYQVHIHTYIFIHIIRIYVSFLSLQIFNGKYCAFLSLPRVTITHIDICFHLFKTRGHLIADVDPLGIQNPESAKLQGTANLPPKIVVRHHLKGMTEADMNREFPLAPFTVIGGDKRTLPLRQILIRLNEVYCGHLGLEYTYIHDLHMVRALSFHVTLHVSIALSLALEQRHFQQDGKENRGVIFATEITWPDNIDRRLDLLTERLVFNATYFTFKIIFYDTDKIKIYNNWHTEQLLAVKGRFKGH